MLDIIIENGYIFINDNLVKANILVKNKKIVGFLKSNYCDGIESKLKIDATDLLALPGMIDGHVHIRAPEDDRKGNFYTESMAAAQGGVTTIIEHPISKPSTHSNKILENRINAAKNSVVNVYFYGAAGVDEHSLVKELSKNKSIKAFKTFLKDADLGRESEFYNMTMKTDYEILKGLRNVSKTGKILAIHAENDSINKGLEKYYRKHNKTSAIYHCYSRPKISEYQTVEKIITFAKETKTKILFCHISCPESLELIYKAKLEGYPIYAETCPQYLLLTEELMEEYGSFAKCNPPLRKRKDLEKMWEYLNNGYIDIISSDHSTGLLEDKYKDNIFDASAGLTGVELRLPLMLNEVNNSKLSLAKLVELLSENPAKLFDLYPEKGRLEVGSDADITLVDLGKEYKIDINKSYSKSKDLLKVYNNKKIKGRVMYTICSGKLVYRDTEM